MINKTLLSLLLALGVNSITQAELYTISINGNDANSGSEANPFRTILHCAQLAKAGDTCQVRAGIYRETVKPINKGTSNAPITFKTYPNEKVLISGADVVSQFSDIGNGRYRANVNWDLGLGKNQVFANGKMLWEARFPNANSDVMSALNGRISNPRKNGNTWTFSDAGIPANLEQAQLTILPGPEWVAETGIVTSSGHNELSFQALYGQLKDTYYNLRNGNPYTIWGHGVLLDDVGEFFHSGNAIEVMVDPATHIIEAKKRNYAFELDGLSHINIEGFHIFAATITTGKAEPSPETLSLYPNTAEAHHININDVHFRYVSHFTYIQPGTEASGPGVFLAWNKGMTNSGVMLFGSNHTLTNSTIAYSAGNGIALAGSNHLIENNIVHDVDYSVTDGAALLAGFYNIHSTGHTVRNNTFYQAARSILTHRDVKNLKILNNELYNAGVVASDLGITYTYKTDGAGTEIAGNRIHGNSREGDFIGIYLDNSSSGINIHHNTVWDVSKAIQLNMPSPNNTVANNTLIGNDFSVSSWVPPNLSNVDISGTSLMNNILVGDRTVYGKQQQLNFAESNNLSSSVQAVGFVNSDSANFSLTESSPAIDAGRVITGITGEFDGAAPDIGAAEGQQQISAGANISEECVYGDSCAPDYQIGSSNPNPDTNINTILTNNDFESAFNVDPNCSHIKGKIAEGWSDNTCWDTNADISYAQDANNPHSGSSSQRIENRGGLVQLIQALDLTTSETYTASLWMRSNSTMNVTLMLRQAASPYTTYSEKSLQLTPQWQQISLTSDTVDANSYFMVRSEEQGTFWIDDAALSSNTPDTPTSTTPSWYMPPAATTWQIQLQGTVNTSYPATVYDLDLYDTSDTLIQQLQQTGKKVICYFSAGSYENWRSDANQFTESDLGKPLDGWPGERWLDVRSANVKRIMQSRLDLAKQKGCDGVDPDNMDGYTNNPGPDFNANDQLEYNRFIAEQAHQRGLAVGLKNDLAQINELVDYYDFAVNEQCAQYNECELLLPFINQGKAVFSIEYQQRFIDDFNNGGGNALCEAAQNRSFSTLVLPLLLNDEFRLSCTENNKTQNQPSEETNSSGGGSLPPYLLIYIMLLTLRNKINKT